MPTPSMAAAIITPARLDFDSRWSSVIIALPAPIAISSANSSSPALRQAAAGARRNSVRNVGAPSRRSISWAAMSASEVATSVAPPQPLPERLDEHDQHRDEEHEPEGDQHGPDHVVGGVVVHDRLVAERQADREERRQQRPAEPEDRVARQHRRVVLVVALAGELARELRLRAPPQPRLLEHVDEDLVAVAVDERVEVEERADVGREGEVEEDV